MHKIDGTRALTEKPPETSLLELIIETAPDAIVTADAEGHIMSFSPAAQRIFGFEEAELVGQNLSILMPEPHRSQHDAYMRRYLETGVKRIIGIGREMRAQRKSGEVFVAELAIGELKMGQDHVFTGFIRDATDRADAETRARDLQRRLERVARIQMLGEMSTALAHEINQPLAAITNFASAAKRLLSTDAPDLDRIGEHVAAIAVQSRRAGEIIRRMRQMVDRGAADIGPDDINEIILEALAVGRLTSEHHGPEVILDLADGLPMVMADRIQIQQVLLNLMRNAFEAVSGGENVLEIETHLNAHKGAIVLKANHSRDEVVVSVTDTGPGIPETDLSTIFDPLVTTKQTGLGVGLAVCRTIVNAHGGRIWAENTDRGAAFHFTLPTVENTAP